MQEDKHMTHFTIYNLFGYNKIGSISRVTNMRPAGHMQPARPRGKRVYFGTQAHDTVVTDWLNNILPA